MLTATKSDQIDLSTEEKTKKFACEFLKKIKPGNIIFLYGEIGVGKTTFVKYLINELQKISNIRLTEITSPTFNLLNEYQINNIKIYHYDLFRIKSADEIKNLNLFEENTKTITFVEWPQIIQKKPKNLVELNFEYGNDHQTRSVQIKGLN